MRKIFLFLTLTLVLSAAKAQTTKGDWMVGGYFRINTSDNNTQIGLTPSAGAFVIDNLALGGNLGFNYSKTGDESNTSFGIGPFARYYFTKANVRPLFHTNLNFLTNKTKFSGISNKNTGINYFLGGGAAIFISEHVSIDALMGYDHIKLKGFDGSGGFAFNVGFQVYLHKSQVDRVRGTK
jgi:hypothetical protein